MLSLTDGATMQIRNIIQSPEVPDGYGVRIAADPGGRLSLELAAMPAEDDQVLDDDGARVFLEPQAAAILNDKALDAQADSTGQVQFSIAETEI